jgi:hypothetical protein
MKFTTTIRLITEAANKDEAAEIAGEYLSGQIASGVEMICRTKRVHKYAAPVISVTVAMVLVAIFVVSLYNIRPSTNFAGNVAGISAVQPPLKTSSNINKQEFKKKWEAAQLKEALNLIKK